MTHEKWPFWNRLLAVLLACALAAALLPARVLAADEGIAASFAISTGVRETPSAEVEILWRDDWFSQDAAVYQHDLAVAAMALSGAAYIGSRDAGIRDALAKLGFGGIRAYHYQFPAGAETDKTAYTFAVKEIGDGVGRKVPLVAIVIRGTGDYLEWVSNLSVGEGSDHAGFTGARDELLANLTQYLSDAGIPAPGEGSTRFLVTGHSRGGAAANLTAAYLTEAAAGKGGVYGYTFAAPAVSVNASEKGYENIFNIVSGDDLVTLVPPAQWGYRRWGVDLLLPARGSGTYAELFDRVDRQYRSLTGRAYAVYQDGDTVRKIVTALVQLVPSTSGTNMAMLSALIRGDLDGLFDLVGQNSMAALLMGGTAAALAYQLEPLVRQERDGMAAAHSMAGYYSWLTACETEEAQTMLERRAPSGEVG